jgi:hypothetical protein
MAKPDEKETRRVADLPIMETQQPDPMLQLTTGRMRASGIALVALALALVLGVVFYGLNSGKETGTENLQTSPASHNSQPQAADGSGPAAPGAPRSNESGVKG